MRRLSAPRVSTAAAVVASIVTVVAVMLPGVGVGESTQIHGGSPIDVFTRSERYSETCTPIGVNVDGVKEIPLQVDVAVPSHLLAYFSFEWTGLESNETAQVNPELVGVEDQDGLIWRFVGNATGAHQGEMVMSSFPNVDPGIHTVDVYAAVASLPFGQPNGHPDAALENCVLTVIVTPVAP